MKNISLLLALIIITLGNIATAQDVIRVHNGDDVIYQQTVEQIDSLKLLDSITNFYPNTGKFSLPTAGIDSITFTRDIDGEIYIIYNGSQTTIINPFSTQGVTITDSLGHVKATSSYPNPDLKYHVLGSTSNGSLQITSTQSIRLIMSHATITNPVGAAIALNGTTVTTMYLSAATINTLSDGSASKDNAALYAKKNLTITGPGTLNLNGYAKHGIKVDATLMIESGIINVAQAESDGFNVKEYTQHGGTITIIPKSDGIDVSNALTLNGGDLTVLATSKDVKGLKATTVTINDGTHHITVSGDQSKAIKSSGNTIINGGNTTIVASGSVVLETSGSGFNPSYCTAIKSDEDVYIYGGHLDILCSSTNLGGKGISVNGDVAISGGYVNIITEGNGANYTNETGAKDSYTSACIKSDGDILLSEGEIICLSTGTGGKGISADGLLVIGRENAPDSLLSLKVTTTGNRFLVSGSGQNADYANPKAIKSEGKLTVNSGIVNVNCTQSTEGGEGLESKSTLYIVVP
ncbi:MAG: carbohydrate-binding domain-containing protein [Chitinophagales bacterium]|nr:carbohydrate-binding domain-containing protein [Chitinophagales bacterium]